MDNVLFIDNSQVVRFTQRLREMHRSDLPVVVRQTLNDTAFDVYKNSMPATFRNEFTVRNKTFLKAHSGVKKAEGFNVSSMKSRVGIIPNGSKAAEGLTKQEFGGSTKRPFMYMDEARVSKSMSKLVRSKNIILGKGGNIVTGTPTIANKYSRKSGYGSRNRKANTVAEAIVAAKTGKFVMWRGSSTETAMFVRSVRFSGKGPNRKVNIKADPIASYVEGYNKKITSTHFLEHSSYKSYLLQYHFFIVNAKRRFER